MSDSKESLEVCEFVEFTTPEITKSANNSNSEIGFLTLIRADKILSIEIEVVNKEIANRNPASLMMKKYKLIVTYELNNTIESKTFSGDLTSINEIMESGSFKLLKERCQFVEVATCKKVVGHGNESVEEMYRTFLRTDKILSIVVQPVSQDDPNFIRDYCELILTYELNNIVESKTYFTHWNDPPKLTKGLGKIIRLL